MALFARAMWPFIRQARQERELASEIQELGAPQVYTHALAPVLRNRCPGTEVIDLAGLFYLTGAAPRPVRRMLLGLWFAQIAVATASVAVTHPPFAVMAPIWGIGVLTLWSSRHGSFPSR